MSRASAARSHGHERALGHPGLLAGEGEQLLDHARRPGEAAAQLAERLCARGRILGALRELRLQPQRCQRRA